MCGVASTVGCWVEEGNRARSIPRAGNIFLQFFVMVCILIYLTNSIFSGN